MDQPSAGELAGSPGGKGPSHATPGYFIIATPGRVGTQWISRALNSHENIFASHGPDLAPAKIVDAETGAASFARNVESITASTFDFSDVDAYFDLLESTGPYAVYGNIHGLFPAKREYRRHYYVCGLVREPVPWVQSFVNRWHRQYEAGGGARTMLQLDEFNPPKPTVMRGIYNRLHKGITDLLGPNAKKLPSGLRPLDPLEEIRRQRRERFAQLVHIGRANPLHVDEALFAKAVDTMLYYTRYSVDFGMPMFKMEEVTGSIEGYRTLFDAVTGGRLAFTPAHWSAVRALGAIDASTDGTLSAREIQQGWQPWQHEYLAGEIERAGLTQFFKGHGYSL